MNEGVMQIMNVREVAKYLRCSESKVRNMVRDKQIPNFRIGSKLNFNKQTIDIWVHNQELRNIQNDDSENSTKSDFFINVKGG